jgi:Protein kinase domain
VSQALSLRHEEPLFLGRYRAVRPLGNGSSGAVWLAVDERDGREVAVKVVPRSGTAEPRARREAQAIAQLDDPRCPRVLACGRDAANVYIALEYVRGRTFREALRGGELTDADAVEAAAQVLEGLAHAHSRGVLHRDVKPANILLAEDGDGISIRLLDFGLARLTNADTLTEAGNVPGTLAYIAPERLRGEEASPAGDVWSAGVVLYEALAGTHPFWRPTLPATADAIARGAEPLARLRPDLPGPLLAAVDRALSVDAARRPSAAKLANVLRRGSRGGGDDALSVAADVAYRFAPPALAGVFAGAAATLLPFFPAHWPVAIAALAAGATLVMPRLGVAFALAVPILPLGNVALALLYAAAAVAWLALHVRDPGRTPFVTLGPLLGPFGALLPLAYSGARSPLVRGLGAAVAVLLAEAVRSVRAGPIGLGLPEAREPIAAAGALVRAVPEAVAIEAAALGAAAILLPYAARRGRWGIAFWGAGTMAVCLLPVPFVPVVVAVWLTCGVLATRT